MDLAFFLRASTHEFSASEEEDDNFWVVHSIDQAWKLLWFVHGALERIGGLFQVNVPTQTCRSYDILNLDLRFAENYDTVPLQLVNNFHNRFPGLSLRFCTGANHLT